MDERERPMGDMSAVPSGSPTWDAGGGVALAKTGRTGLTGLNGLTGLAVGAAGLTRSRADRAARWLTMPVSSAMGCTNRQEAASASAGLPASTVEGTAATKHASVSAGASAGASASERARHPYPSAPGACSKPVANLIAGLCAAGGLAHLATLTPGATGALGVHGWVFAAMAVACLLCAVHLLWARSCHALGMTVAMAALMLVVHTGYLLAVAPGFALAETGHAHRSAGSIVHLAPAQHASHALTSPGTAAPMLAELAVLVVAVPVLRRLRLTR
ncbi:hypothetical protein Kisp01_35230 [Kineosporia sp. NBRC 101677]|nr:hypothetical protein Kisp01_35230 [Kineosporia sp. NBRC 101677]